jgi:hypothetical protein
MTTKTKLDLSQFYGTEHWYRHPIYQSVTFTDGVKYIADECEAYWLIDLLAATFVTYNKKHYFQCYTLNVDLAQNTATLVVTNGDDEPITNITIEFTDFPVETITIWGIDGVLLLPSEY